jgi:hypothetical protein
MYASYNSEASKRKLRILLWGPTPSAHNPLALKREGIRDALKGNGHDVWFSEDMGLTGFRPPLNVEEQAQLKSFQLYICLASAEFAPGALSEATEFGPTLGKYFRLWLPEKAQGKYVDQALGACLRLVGNAPLFFKEDDLDSCVVSAASSEWVEQWRAFLWSIDRKREDMDKIDPRKRGQP